MPPRATADPGIVEGVHVCTETRTLPSVAVPASPHSSTSSSTTVSDIMDSLVHQKTPDPLFRDLTPSEENAMQQLPNEIARYAYGLPRPTLPFTRLKEPAEDVANLCRSLSSLKEGWLDNEHRRINRKSSKIRRGIFEYETAAAFEKRMYHREAETEETQENQDGDDQDENGNDADPDGDGSNHGGEDEVDVEDKIATATRNLIASKESEPKATSPVEIEKEAETEQVPHGGSGSDHLLRKGLSIIKQGAKQAQEDNDRSSPHAIPPDELVPELEQEDKDFRLRPHQKDGIGRMLYMEKTMHAWMLSDDMGLGKTLQVIGLIKKDKQRNPDGVTLGVVPRGLLTYWNDEFKRVPSLKVLVYHRSFGQFTMDYTKAQLLEYDVILTNYETLVKQWTALETVAEDWRLLRLGHKTKQVEIKSSSKKRKRPSENEDEKAYEEKPLVNERAAAPLFSIRFHRVFLDEAHRIKEMDTKTSKAAAALEAVNRGCVTGTPLQNDYDDFFSITRFLHLVPWNNWDFFRDCFMKTLKNENSMAAAQLDVDLQNALACIRTCITIRRVKTQLFDGEPIIGVREVEVEWQPVFLNAKNQQVVNKMRDLWDPAHRAILKANKISKTGEQPPHRPDIFADLTRGQLEAMDPRLVDAKYGDLGTKDVDLPKTLAEVDDEERVKARLVLKDRAQMLEQYQESEAQPEDKNADMKTGKERRAAFIKNVTKDASPHSDFIKHAGGLIARIIDEEKKRSMSFSDGVKRKQEQAYGKILVFCPFLSALDVLRVALQCIRVQVYELNGHCNERERTEVLRKFEEQDVKRGEPKNFLGTDFPDTVRVLLASTRVAADGFNLVHACHVVMLGLSWNPFVHLQALSRANRMGQPRQVCVYYVYTENSMHNRVERTQRIKLRKVAGVMDRVAVREAAPEILKWNVGTLRNLIGKNG